MRIPKRSLLLVGFLMSHLVSAETLSLNSEDVARLDIQFAPVVMADHQSGSRVSATVINSPETQSTITALYSGIIEQWLVAPGAAVTEGTVLARVSSQQMMVVQQDWIAVKTKFDQAQFSQKKDRNLFSDGVISEQRLKQTQRYFQQAKFELEAMSERLAQAGFTDASKQKLVSGEIKPGVYFITAPCNGSLSKRYFNVGEYVEVSETVASLKRQDLPWVRAKVSVAAAAMLQIGQVLSLANSNSLLILKQKNLQVDMASQMVEILAEFNQRVAAMEGQIVSLVLPPASEGVLIPSSAVIHTKDETNVYVRTDSGVEVRKLLLQPIGAHYLALDGITPGEEVVIQGASVLKGMTLGLGEGE